MPGGQRKTSRSGLRNRSKRMRQVALRHVLTGLRKGITSGGARSTSLRGSGGDGPRGAIAGAPVPGLVAGRAPMLGIGPSRLVAPTRSVDADGARDIHGVGVGLPTYGARSQLLTSAPTNAIVGGLQPRAAWRPCNRGAAQRRPGPRWRASPLGFERRMSINSRKVDSIPLAHRGGGRDTARSFEVRRRWRHAKAGCDGGRAWRDRAHGRRASPSSPLRSSGHATGIGRESNVWVSGVTVQQPMDDRWRRHGRVALTRASGGRAR